MANRAPMATVDDLLEHVGWARRLARTLTADADEAEDLLQEAWIAAARRPPATDRPLRPWLAVVLRNLFINKKVARRRRVAHEQGLMMEAAALSPEALVEKVEGQRLLAELVAGLEEPYRQALILRYFDGLSGAEIARRLDVPAGTVRWRLKNALDELRCKLDERYGGRRAVWTAALLPLGGGLESVGLARSARVGLSGRRWLTRPWWPLPIGAVGASLGLVFCAAVSRAPAARDGTMAAAIRQTWTARIAAWSRGFMASGDLAGCQQEVRRLRAEDAAVQAQLRRSLMPSELFRLGEPNPRALAAVAPVVERALAGRSSDPVHSVECRTFCCRVLVVGPHGGRQPWDDWPSILQIAFGFGRKMFMVVSYPPNPTVDQVSGEGLMEEEMFVVLPRDQNPAPPEAPLPSTASACQAERDRLRVQIALARDQAEAREPDDTRFARAGAPNPRLAQEVRRQMPGAFPGLHTGNVQVECRGQLCLVKWPTGPMSWPGELHNGPWFRNRIANKSGSPSTGIYLDLTTRPRADGTAFLEDLVARFERSSVPADCASRATGRGALQVKFYLRRMEIEGRPDDPPPLTARFGGGLAATPLGRCLQAAIERDILAAPLPPAPMSGATVYHRFEFPRPLRPR
jgi:RNA polymerase sigma-70 factor (ECF subfamily)